jgi:Cu-processing system ATP-binding protein
MPERIALYENMTGEATLRYLARLKGVSTSTVEPVLERVGLAGAARRKLGGYSKGMRQRLNFAQALLGDPRVMVLDEPIEGLDALAVREFFEILKSDSDRTVVISSHRMPLIAQHVDRMCVLSEGRITALGTENELQQQLNLPARIVLHPMPGAMDRLATAVEGFEAVTVLSRNGRVVVSLPQGEKLRFLSNLGAIADSIHDIRVEEPTLEEVLLEKS